MATATGNTADTDRIGIKVVFTDTTSMGGYVVFMLNWLAKLFGNGSWAFLKSTRLPKSKDEARQLTHRSSAPMVANQAKQAGVDNPSLFITYVDDNGVCYVVLGGADGWWSRSAVLSGLRIWAIKKVIKRLKSFNRPTILGGELSQLRVKVVPDEAFLNNPNFKAEVEAKLLEYPEDIRPTYKEQAAKLLDGIGFVKPSFRNTLIEISEFSEDPIRRGQQIANLKKSWVFNGRIWCELGFIKGNFLVTAPGAYEDEDWDFMVPESAIKEEVLSLKHNLVIMEPQGPKTKVVTDVQTMLNNKWLHPRMFMVVVIKDFFAQLRTEIASGKALDSFADLESQRARGFSKGRYEQTLTSAMKYSALENAMRKLDYRKSPFTIARLVDGKVSNLLDNRNGRLRIPLPCVISEQVISESAARAAGYDMAVNYGDCKRLVEQGVHVMNDLHFVFSYEDQGGWDQDDFAKLFYRMMDGRKVIIVVRSPNELGQYSVLNYVEGEKFPTYTKADGEVISFPPVNGERAPKQLSVALKDGSTRYTGLPSSKLPKSDAEPEEYSLDFADADIMACVGLSDPGYPSNIRMLWSDTVQLLRAAYLCSQEDMVDATTQREAGSGIIDGKAIMEEAEEMLNELAFMGKSFDLKFCQTRHLVGPLLKLNPDVKFHNGDFSVLWAVMEKEITAFRDWAYQFSQDNASSPSPFVEDLGGYNWKMRRVATRDQTAYRSLMPLHQKYLVNYDKAFMLVQNVRGAVGSANGQMWADFRRMCAELGLRVEDQPEPKLPAAEYVRLYKPLMEHFESMEGIDRHLFAMSVMAVVYQIKVNNKKRGVMEISDGILWSSMVDKETGKYQGPYRYIIDALVFFGIAAEPTWDEENQRPLLVTNGGWELMCPICDRDHVTDNPEVMATFLTQGKCNICRREGK